MRKILFTLAIAFSVFSFGQKMTDPLAMIPEGTVITLTTDHVLPADSSTTIFNSIGKNYEGGHYSQIQILYPASKEWRLVKKGTSFTVKGFVYLPNSNAFKILLDQDHVFLYISGIVRPMLLTMNVVGDYFDMKFPPMKIYGTDEYVAPKDTIIIHPLLPGQVDSIQKIAPDTLIKK